ncbi:hypothetical protein HDC94_001418 [Leifsonia sp. AK011]|uniref:hypothetical protein n=1 Tax=Leifsonia sp. AK011 TaxID=2723075 RepID=UPI0015CC8D11|nr:hypothetical protein [Leifsonia sp. AK011]NYF10262.1 hypothetical protein [Leifsonia sp. AK011]
MLRSSRPSSDAGTASLEFIVAGLLLLVPLVYLVLTIGQIQAAALAAEGGARQAARVFVLAPTADDGRAAVETAVEFALADHGVKASSIDVRITCTPTPTECHTPRGFVTVAVALEVPLPLVPPMFGGELTVPIEASTTQQVSRFWSAG